MQILVPIKRVPDPDQGVRVRADGKGIDTDDVFHIVNPFDAIAVEEALRISECASEEVEVVCVSVGPKGVERELRSCLAMGASRGILVSHETPLDPWNVARVLEAVVRRESPRFVLMGKQAVDDDSGQTGQFLAALLGWPQATFASELELRDESLRVARETDAGIERVRVTLPAVVTSDLRLNEPRYASLPNIIKAKKKPVDVIDVRDLGVSIEPRVEVVCLESSTTTRRCVRASSVDELVEKLRAAKIL